jgi:hypothetical protein
MTLRAWLVPLICGVVGVVVGWRLLPRAEAPATAPAAFAASPIASESAQVPGPAGVSSGGLTADDVRRVVREELAVALRESRTGPLAAGEAVAPVPPTPAQDAALLRANQLLAGAISRRQWTDDDADTLRAELHTLTPEQQGEVLRQYAVAVNQGRIVPQSDRPPF